MNDHEEETRLRLPATPRETMTGLSPLVGSVGERLSLLVISEKIVATYPLPESGEVHIGRSPQCEIIVDDPQVSRVHATLLVGAPMFLCDLGSANGTRLRDQSIDRKVPVEIAPGDVVQIGPATLIVQRRSLPVRARRIWSHDYFEVRLDEECARAGRGGSGFAIARLRCTTPVPKPIMQEALAELVRAGDVIGDYGPDEHEFLLFESDREEAERVVARVVAGLAARGLAVRDGMACFPADGRGADELLLAARPDPRLRDARAEVAEVAAVIAADRRMSDLYQLADRVAQGTISVLILGETGTGKEVLAQRVHDRSPRAGKAYLKLNCAALSETLLESELFGHERGAFTGALTAKPGLLETADGGTVFLDELGELPHAVQVKLLRVLEERTVTRVGGLKPRTIDVRFVAATNRDLEADIARNTFRQDLYFRVNGATLVIPPLRERVDEIPQLVKVFLGQAAKAIGLQQAPSVSSEAMAVLRGYSWPGNIRELRNVIERAVLLANGGLILPAQLPLDKMRATMPGRMAALSGPPEPLAAARPPPPPPVSEGIPEDSFDEGLDLTTSVTLRPGPRPDELTPAGRRRRTDDDDAERARIEAALDACAGNQTAASAMLGISRRTLINRLEEFGLSRPRKGR